MSTIKPTIGRKVWFYDSATGTPPYDKPPGGYDKIQPFDATIIYVWGDTCVNLDVTAHDGSRHIKTSVPLRDPAAAGAEPDCHNGYYATWMPYQTAQAAKAEADKPAA